VDAPCSPGRRGGLASPLETLKPVPRPKRRMWFSARARISFEVSCDGLAKSSWSLRIDRHSAGTCSVQRVNSGLVRESEREGETEREGTHLPELVLKLE